MSVRHIGTQTSTEKTVVNDSSLDGGQREELLKSFQFHILPEGLFILFANSGPSTVPVTLATGQVLVVIKFQP